MIFLHILSLVSRVFLFSAAQKANSKAHFSHEDSVLLHPVTHRNTVLKLGALD